MRRSIFPQPYSLCPLFSQPNSFAPVAGSPLAFPAASLVWCVSPALPGAPGASHRPLRPGPWWPWEMHLGVWGAGVGSYGFMGFYGGFGVSWGFIGELYHETSVSAQSSLTRQQPNWWWDGPPARAFWWINSIWTTSRRFALFFIEKSCDHPEDLKLHGAWETEMPRKRIVKVYNGWSPWGDGWNFGQQPSEHSECWPVLNIKREQCNIIYSTCACGLLRPASLHISSTIYCIAY